MVFMLHHQAEQTFMTCGLSNAQIWLYTHTQGKTVFTSVMQEHTLRLHLIASTYKCEFAPPHILRVLINASLAHQATPLHYTWHVHLLELYSRRT